MQTQLYNHSLFGRRRVAPQLHQHGVRTGAIEKAKPFRHAQSRKAILQPDFAVLKVQTGHECLSLFARNARFLPTRRMQRNEREPANQKKPNDGLERKREDYFHELSRTRYLKSQVQRRGKYPRSLALIARNASIPRRDHAAETGRETRRELRVCFALEAGFQPRR